MKGKGAVILLAILIIAGVLAAVAVDKGKSSGDNPATARNLKGVSLSPKSFEAADFTSFFQKAKEAGTVISWAGDWKQLREKDAAPYVIMQLAQQYQYTPVIIIDFPLKDDEADFLSTVTSFAKENNPEYIGIGNEVNFNDDPVAFEEGVASFNKAYDSIKSVSPKTKVFTIFQYESLKGLRGGLFGGVNNPAAAEWSLLNLAGKSDVIAFTTYPGIIYQSPEDIPPDYYSEIAAHTSKQIIFTEIGWFREGPTEIKGWESTQEEQAEFIRTFSKQTSSLPIEIKIWPFLYDYEKRELFSTMGLLRHTEETSPALEAWKEI